MYVLELLKTNFFSYPLNRFHEKCIFIKDIYISYLKNNYNLLFLHLIFQENGLRYGFLPFYDPPIIF